MFTLGQILTSTQLIRNFHRILKELQITPQPILITQRNGYHMVLVNAEVFEELTVQRLKKDGVDVVQSHLKAIIDAHSRML